MDWPQVILLWPTTPQLEHLPWAIVEDIVGSMKLLILTCLDQPGRLEYLGGFTITWWTCGYVILSPRGLIPLKCFCEIGIQNILIWANLTSSGGHISRLDLQPHGCMVNLLSATPHTNKFATRYWLAVWLDHLLPYNLYRPYDNVIRCPIWTRTLLTWTLTMLHKLLRMYLVDLSSYKDM